MPRIAGVDIPKNKQIWIALRYIYGIGPTFSRQILDKAGIAHETKADDLSEEEVNRLREIVDKGYRVEGELRKEINVNIRRLIDIGTYRGNRHRYSLPVDRKSTRLNS